ncbi:hypothetical protein DCCM_3760 [Desulfocucumis palustris]|uniref:Uncharacterized protein n=1 Tax=Desulfocucumis palustris TaxID=1898651 RepID=A0A2L2XEQ2_9FIRM|nr:hypothetical protein [Desulfocucumis palustris]GBF34640.1 hypothetical protein DCCM_3760 [Desulfocucumis palustris]
MIKKIIDFLRDDRGITTAEWAVILFLAGLSSVSIGFGFSGALRGLAGRSIENIQNSAP